MVSDVMLPHINGRKLAEIARAARPDLKVLFVTGYAENFTSRGEFLDPGMDMLTKPFALDDLGAKIRALIEPWRSVRPQPDPSAAIERGPHAARQRCHLIGLCPAAPGRDRARHARPARPR